MKKAFILILLYAINCTSQTPSFSWAKTFGGTSADYARCITVDAAGNVYTAGAFTGTVDFNSGTGVYTLAAVGMLDIYITKYTASGNFVWARAMGSTATEEALGIDLDASANIHITGYFFGNVDFDPGTGTAITPNIGSGYDVFVAKYDSVGNYQWVQVIGGNGVNNYGTGITVDGAGNIYTTGEFGSTVDFDPGSSTYNLTSAGLTDIFVSKLDNAGNFVWASAMGGTATDAGKAISLDNNGNVLTTGNYQGTADFDPGPGTSNMASVNNTGDIFISKLNSSGSFVWARSIGGSLGLDMGNGIGTDGSANVYVTGSFQGSADFDPGAGSYSLSAGASNIDAFNLKLDNAGTFQWAFSIGSSATSEYGTGIAVTSGGDVYTTGVISGTGDFDPGTGTVVLATTGSQDVYVQKVSTSASYGWAVVYGSSNGSDRGEAIALDGAGNVLVSGHFEMTPDFNPGTATYTASSSGGYDAFIEKFCQATPPVISASGTTTICPGASVTLISSSAASYTWSNGAGTSSIAAGNAGVYSATVTDNNGCRSSSNSLTVTLLAPALITLNGGSICAGQSFTFLPSGGITYTFVNGGPVVSPQVTTVYSVSGTAANGCTSTSLTTALLTVNPIPTISVSGTTLCAGNSYTVIPTGASTYSISGNSFVVSPAASTSYSITGTSAQGCTSSPAVITVTILQLPLPVISASSGTICTGENYTIIVNGASSYTYSSGSAIVAPLSSATYTVIGSSPAGCLSLPVISTVAVNANPNIQIVPDRTLACIGETLSLSGSGANTYTWNGGIQQTVITVTASLNSTYSLSGTDVNGCKSAANLLLNVDECASIKTHFATTISVFPNPFKSELCIKSGSATRLIVVDATGRTVITKELQTGVNYYSFDSLPYGLYYFIFSDGETNSMVKVARHN